MLLVNLKLVLILKIYLLTVRWFEFDDLECLGTRLLLAPRLLLGLELVEVQLGNQRRPQQS